MSAILIVDDIEQNRYMLRSILTAVGHTVTEAQNGSEALVSARSDKPDLIISDILMPQTDGFAFCRECKRDNELRPIPFIFYTATYTDPRDEQLAMDLGAERFLVKPVEPDILISIVAEILNSPQKSRSHHDLVKEEDVFYRMYIEALVRKLEDKMIDVERANRELANAYDATIEGWSRALDLRDKETEGHSQRVTEMTIRLARAAGVTSSDLVHIRRGALLHDIGKLGVPDHILLKPGRLTDEEWIHMRKHPQYAYDMLASIEYLRPALDIPYCHHEKWDGGGYPRGLRGEQIPLSARLFAVVDVWDAVRSDRPYRGGWPVSRALAYIESESGKHFDPRIVPLFLTLISEFG